MLENFTRFNLRYLLKFLFSIMLICAMFSCKDDEEVLDESEENVAIPNQSIEDEYGRTLILHGWNTSSSAKVHPERQPWIEEADVEREYADFGNNFVRYLIFWDGVEAVQGVYDEAYLDKVEERVNWYTSRGMYVMLDMHQDLYSIVFGGDGAPEWAIQTNGHPIDGNIDGPWWLQNVNPAVIACWTNFWQYSNYQYLQDHYIAMWQHVVDRFKDNPYVIGYDLMNEPWGGDLIQTFITGDFERYQLAAFYNRLVPAIRDIDPDGYIFVEPAPAPVTFGAPSRLPKIEDVRPDPRIVYAPHCYPYDTHEGIGYTYGSKVNLRDWERERKKEVLKYGRIPLVCGEFGLSPYQDGFDEYLIDVMEVFDRNRWNWAYWSSDLGGWGPLDANKDESPILDYIVRTYPKATSGILYNFELDWDTKTFTMQFESTNTGKPTEIFIPQRHYPNGWELFVDGTENYSENYNSANQTLSLDISDYGKMINVQIIAK